VTRDEVSVWWCCQLTWRSRGEEKTRSPCSETYTKVAPKPCSVQFTGLKSESMEAQLSENKHKKKIHRLDFEKAFRVQSKISLCHV